MDVLSSILAGIVIGVVASIYIGIVDPQDAKYTRELESLCLECVDSLDACYKENKELKSNFPRKSERKLTTDERELLNLRPVKKLPQFLNGQENKKAGGQQ